jgi:hypothetical protein
VLYAVALLPKILLGVVVLAAAPPGFTFGTVFRRGQAAGDARGFTVVQLMLALGAIGVLVLVPAVAARRVHASRIRAAHAQVDAVAERLRGISISGGVLAGAGATPASTDDRWISGARTSIPIAGMQPDPWGNQLLVKGRSAMVWVLSAGENGIVETPFDGATEPGGDDIGARIR